MCRTVWMLVYVLMRSKKQFTMKGAGYTQFRPEFIVYQEGFYQSIEELRDNISMDVNSVWRDSVFFEYLWYSVKYDEAYLNAYASLSEA